MTTLPKSILKGLEKSYLKHKDEMNAVQGWDAYYNGLMDGAEIAHRQAAQDFKEWSDTAREVHEKMLGLMKELFCALYHIDYPLSIIDRDWKEYLKQHDL